MSGEMVISDTIQPHPARMYDYWLGGKDNYASDREAAEKVMERAPDARNWARANRAWMHRVVRFIAREAGIRQFLDIGTGIPTAPNLHQVAQEVAPECRVVYVDNDCVVLRHAEALMDSSPEGRTAFIQADVRDPERILSHAALRKTLDFSHPVGLVLAAVLHFVPGLADVRKIVATLLAELPPGSHLALSHATADMDPEKALSAAAVYRQSGATATMTLRTRAEIEGLFTGCELLEPGVVPVNTWRPDGPFAVGPQSQAWIYGGVGRVAGGENA